MTRTKRTYSFPFHLSYSFFNCWKITKPTTLEFSDFQGFFINCFVAGLISPPPPSSKITRLKYVGRNRVNWTYWAIELYLSDTLNYKPFFKNCILQTVLHVFSLFIFMWNNIFCYKNWAVFYILLIWFGVAFGVAVLKVLCFWFFSLYGIRHPLTASDIIC